MHQLCTKVSFNSASNQNGTWPQVARILKETTYCAVGFWALFSQRVFSETTWKHNSANLLFNMLCLHVLHVTCQLVICLKKDNRLNPPFFPEGILRDSGDRPTCMNFCFQLTGRIFNFLCFFHVFFWRLDSLAAGFYSCLFTFFTCEFFTCDFFTCGFFSFWRAPTFYLWIFLHVNFLLVDFLLLESPHFLPAFFLLVGFLLLESHHFLHANFWLVEFFLVESSNFVHVNILLVEFVLVDLYLELQDSKFKT